MTTETLGAKSMDEIVALCKRRGFIYPASEIYGGINGFWDYGPLGVELKNNVRDAWWNDMVRCPPVGPDGEPLEIVGVDSSIIQNPKVWEASGHVAGFNDPMVDDRQTKQRYRADQLWTIRIRGDKRRYSFVDGDDDARLKAFDLLSKYVKRPVSPDDDDVVLEAVSAIESPAEVMADIVAPNGAKPGTLTEPRLFNLMFMTWVGAVQDEDARAYLRPETAQGIFLNFKNVVDTMRVKIPFGIAQVGKAFRNEVNPRNFVFRSREFEQMEMEWFCHPDDAARWFDFWVDLRLRWWQSLGLSGENLRIRPHDAEERSHYAREGVGTADLEYRWPFTWPEFGELEGVSHRTNYDLAAHERHSGIKLQYFDPERNARYVPHVIEPAAGLTRGLLAVICEAYTPDPGRPSKVFLRFHPRLAPIQAAIFPLVAKEGMPEIACRLYDELRGRFACQFDVKQNIGKRYARMDEAGTPFCFTVDGQTTEDDTVTVRFRDDARQERIGIGSVGAFLGERIATPSRLR